MRHSGYLSIDCIRNFSIHNFSTLIFIAMNKQVKEFLKAKSAQYQKLRSTISTLEESIQQQNQLKLGTIPEELVPKPNLTCENDIFHKQFLSEYTHIFTKYLEAVITSNNQSLAQAKMALESLVNDTERDLLKFEIRDIEIQRLYKKFLKENNIHEHVPTPELQVRLDKEHRPPGLSLCTKRASRRKRCREASRHPTTQQPIKFLKHHKLLFYGKAPNRSTTHQVRPQSELTHPHYCRITITK